MISTTRQPLGRICNNVPGLHGSTGTKGLAGKPAPAPAMKKKTKAAQPANQPGQPRPATREISNVLPPSSCPSPTRMAISPARATSSPGMYTRAQAQFAPRVGSHHVAARAVGSRVLFSPVDATSMMSPVSMVLWRSRARPAAYPSSPSAPRRR